MPVRPIRSHLRSRRTRSAAVASVVALAVGAAVIDDSPSDAAYVGKIRLVEVQRRSTQIDLGKTGFSPGDRQTIVSDIYTPSGSKAGRLDDDCVITQAGRRPEAVCTFVLSLRHGQLTGAFAENLAGSDVGKTQAITGGTRRYAGAHGELVAGREGRRTPFTVVLQS
jgi:hypothetical protein